MQDGEHTQWGLLAPWRRWGTDDGDAGAGRAGGLWPDKRLLEAWWGFTRWSSEYVWESMWVCRVLDRMTAVSEHKAPPRPLATPPVQLRALRRSDQRTRGPLWLVTMDRYPTLQAAPLIPLLLRKDDACAQGAALITCLLCTLMLALFSLFPLTLRRWRLSDRRLPGALTQFVGNRQAAHRDTA